jgi:hypothetical protein
MAASSSACGLSLSSLTSPVLTMSIIAFAVLPAGSQNTHSPCLWSHLSNLWSLAWVSVVPQSNLWQQRA